MRKNILQISLLSLLVLVVFMAWPDRRTYDERGREAIQPPPFCKVDSSWADSVLASLTLDERIAQMMMVQAYSNLGEDHRNSILKHVTHEHIGGIAFFQGDPVAQAMLTNEYQDASKVPLLIAIDGENGLGMRLKNTIRYPQQMALGAISDPALIFRLGKDMGAQMKRLGVQLNFAPVADVNNNPANPVINTRSFGEDPANVAEKVCAIMQGMQSERLLVAAKHFPGHGDTDADSHHALPVLQHARTRLDSVEIRPFREAIQRGLSAIMVAHLQVPALDPRENRPATVSDLIVNDLLAEELGFKGLIITDALNMKGLSRHLEPGRREVEAVKAGNDILLMPADVDLAIREIRKAIRRGEISEQRINQSCRKILQAKYWTGLAARKPVEISGLVEDLNQEAYQSRYRELVAASLTLVRNRDELIPLKGLDQVKLATLTISSDGEKHFGATSDLYLEGDHYTLSRRCPESQRRAVLEKLEAYHLVIINVLGTSSYASRSFGITDECIDLVEALPRDKKLILNLAGYPYALGRFPDLDHIDAILLSYSEGYEYQSFTQQAIFGGRSMEGTLPVSWEGQVSAGGGCHTVAGRLGYALPYDEGLDPDTLALIDDIVHEAIRDKAMPGCQILVARRGMVVWNQSYGYHTYSNRRPVQNTDLYDLASLTKITATLPMMMRLRDQGLFHEDSTLGVYLEFPDTCNKNDLKIADILAHQAGLQSWIPFYHITLEPLNPSQSLVRHNWSPVYSLKIGPSEYANKNVRYVDSVYSSNFSSQYPMQVAESLYMNRDYRDSIYRIIDESELLEPEYLYSDLGYYYFKRILEARSDTMLYPYVWYHLYAPLGARRLGFLPLNRFGRQEIVPTENDLFFRRQLIHGYVHDPGAAMLGGIAGHAGLFGNAQDLAKMMQMYLNGGCYGGKRYISNETLERFTSCYACEQENRRGLGFDRPMVGKPGEGPACDSASAISFGHSGFTGTLAWADPAHDLLYIFLSNRVYPDQANNLLIETDVRTRIQQVVYDALLN